MVWGVGSPLNDVGSMQVRDEWLPGYSGKLDIMRHCFLFRFNCDGIAMAGTEEHQGTSHSDIHPLYMIFPNFQYFSLIFIDFVCVCKLGEVFPAAAGVFFSAK